MSARRDRGFGAATTVVPAVLASLLFAAGCEAPPIETEQTGYRGTGMAKVINPDARAETAALHEAPEPEPPATAGGPKAGEIYQNVQVLGDLSVGEFTRLMNALTAWVSPEEGCGYCHAGADLASDDVYTKVVSRRMIEMTQHINSQWQDHVAGTGVTCHTCHRGNPVPGHIWFRGEDAGPMAAGLGALAGQNVASAEVGYTSLPNDPFSPYVESAGEIRVVASTALPLEAGTTVTIQQTEQTYGLMMHMSEALGVNCTVCHNSRSFFAWDQSTPQRQSAWYGIRMLRDLNQDYLMPLRDEYPRNRLGPTGDAPKANCATCHQGAQKPLNGASMVADYPSLAHP